MPEPFQPSSYGDAIADVYDEWIGDGTDGAADAAVRFLAGLAGEGGSAVELGVGTGRIAIPLAARGIRVTGVEASSRMVQQLRAKPGGVDLPVIVGDMADVPVPGSVDLVYVVASTLYGLTEQEAQLRCLCNARARLRPGGQLVVESFVPDPSRFDRGQRVDARTVDAGGVRLDVTRHDPVTQTLLSQQIAITPDGVRMNPTRLRYIWPAELDLMAKLAGLTLVRRDGGWYGEPYTAASGSHVSVYQRHEDERDRGGTGAAPCL